MRHVTQHCNVVIELGISRQLGMLDNWARLDNWTCLDNWAKGGDIGPHKVTFLMPMLKFCLNRDYSLPPPSSFLTVGQSGVCVHC